MVEIVPIVVRHAKLYSDILQALYPGMRDFFMALDSKGRKSAASPWNLHCLRRVGDGGWLWLRNTDGLSRQTVIFSRILKGKSSKREGRRWHYTLGDYPVTVAFFRRNIRVLVWREKGFMHRKADNTMRILT